jgi:hypothetical protein
VKEFDGIARKRKIDSSPKKIHSTAEKPFDLKMQKVLGAVLNER